MFMRSLETNAGRREHRASGFSLIEMMMVVALVIVMASITFVSLVPLMKQQRVINAYNTTLSVMRQARDNAIAQRTSYQVVFSTTTSPHSITVTPRVTFTGDQPTTSYQLPTDVFFLAPPTGTAAPETGFGTGANAIDFGYTASGNAGGVAAYTIYFCPDGSSQTASTCNGVNNWDGGVVYLGRTGEVLSERAITLWGGTGRIHGWRLYPNGAGYQWLRQ
jgi:prepilin-type N-terminal cleavage/methylation domain-containing protein